MANTYKLLAALLDYPSKLTQQIIKDLDEVLEECSLLDEEGQRCVRDFAKAHHKQDLLHWQQAYSEIFDVAPITSLYLFEHVYGSSMKRGSAMSSLIDTYAQHGLQISNLELPDYLPVYLDFLSTLEDPKEALSYLADTKKILDSIHEGLKKHDSEYALLIKPLLKLAAKGEPHPIPESSPKAEADCPLVKNKNENK